MCHVNAQQRVSSEEDFNNHIVKMTLSVDTIQYLPSATPVIIQWANEKEPILEGMKVIHGLDNIDSPRSTWLCPLLSAQSANSRDLQVPGMAPFPGVINQQPGGRLTT